MAQVKRDWKSRYQNINMVRASTVETYSDMCSGMCKKREPNSMFHRRQDLEKKPAGTGLYKTR